MSEVKVALVLLVKDKKILVVSRKDNHKSFGLIGGKMDEEDNGDFKKTAIRETKEETGVDISNQDLIELVDLYYRGNQCKTYLVTDFEGEISTNEAGVVKWGTPKDLIDGSYGDYNRTVLEKYMEYMDAKKIVGEVIVN